MFEIHVHAKVIMSYRVHREN